MVDKKCSAVPVVRVWLVGRPLPKGMSKGIIGFYVGLRAGK